MSLEAPRRRATDLRAAPLEKLTKLASLRAGATRRSDDVAKSSFHWNRFACATSSSSWRDIGLEECLILRAARPLARSPARSAGQQSARTKAPVGSDAATRARTSTWRPAARSLARQPNWPLGAHKSRIERQPARRPVGQLASWLAASDTQH